MYDGGRRCCPIRDWDPPTSRFGSESTTHAISRSLRYHPLFEHDLLSAAEWYDERNPILGDDFLVRVRGAIEDLTTDPKRRASIDFGIRYWPVQRFPYVVFYDLFDSEILILGVMHTSQEPSKWLAQRK
ncbi:MAG: type II toxin-antitoxin system RelE/ParE family toxin [Pirellulaceae bacterium]